MKSKTCLRVSPLGLASRISRDMMNRVASRLQSAATEGEGAQEGSERQLAGFILRERRGVRAFVPEEQRQETASTGLSGPVERGREHAYARARKHSARSS